MGNVAHAAFAPQTNMRRVFVATEARVVAALNTKNGAVVWRHVRPDGFARRLPMTSHGRISASHRRCACAQTPATVALQILPPGDHIDKMVVHGKILITLSGVGKSAVACAGLLATTRRALRCLRDAAVLCGLLGRLTVAPAS